MVIEYELMPLRAVELFAGVGGFRIGLEGHPGAEPGSIRVVWANQWEPSTKKQHAAEVYVARWGLKPDPSRPTRFVHPTHAEDVLVNEDISTINAADVPQHDLLCGGFPCQDYSVAKTLDKAAGLGGKKGVLWWEIHRIAAHHRPKHLLLENVDRLLKSPRGQRGRDLAVMLASLDELGYMVEWRVVDASAYGFPQRACSRLWK
jgi:DNA (cytosine-5)-methyltransferase 1